MPPVNSNIESASWSNGPVFGLTITGWCVFNDGRACRGISVWLENERIHFAPTTTRPDVQKFFSDIKGAYHSGFAVNLGLIENNNLVELHAEDERGHHEVFHSFLPGDVPGRGPIINNYTAWSAEYDPVPARSIQTGDGPLFTIVLPVYNTPLSFLSECIESVQKQFYVKWEICAVDDSSTDAGVLRLLHEFSVVDRRIKLQSRSSNGGIARATNDALAMAHGEFVVFLDHDDLLRPHALAEFAACLQKSPALDAVYSDEDKITSEGIRREPFLKPDFSPEFLLGVMYIGHALCVRTDVARSVGGFDPAFDGIQDFEFFLRVTERTRRIGHIPRILYHWRQSPTSSALDGNVKGNMDEKQADAVRAHLQRRGRKDRVVLLGRHRIRLLSYAQLPGIDLFVSEGITLPEKLPVETIASGSTALEGLRQACDQSQAEVIVLLTVSLLDCSKGWLNELVALAALPDSGLIAPLLLEKSGKVLESGWTLGPVGAFPLMRCFDATGDGYNGSLVCNREVAAVSSLCVAVRRETLGKVLASLPADADWWDFCICFSDLNLFHRVCASAQIRTNRSWNERHESQKIISADVSRDRFFNPHFDCISGDYRLGKRVSVIV